MSPPVATSRQIAVPIAAAALAAAVYLATSPPSTDLAAQTFRTDLFAEHGFVLWNNAWYLGHHTLSYSVLFPPLAAAIGVELAGALAAVAAAAFFAVLVRRRFGDRALLGSLWFAIGIGAWLFTGRMTFLLGVAFGLAALLALEYRRLGWCAVLAVLCTLASPVAGFFLCIAGAAIALAGERRSGIALALPAGAAILALGLAFPASGQQPYPGSTYFPIPIATVIALWVIPREHRLLRTGILVYGVLATLLLVVPTPIGTNAARLGALFAGPVAALVLIRRPALLAALAAPLLVWQLISPVEDLAKGVDDPASERAFYDPLLAELDRMTAKDAPVRIEIPPTNNRWEAAYVAPSYPLARGWMRQLESDDFDLFIDGDLTPAAYRGWLDDQAVSYVAVADAEPDYLARDEVDLVEDGLPYLVRVWESEDWRLYRVRDARSIASGGALLTAIGPDWFELEISRAGRFEIAIEHSRYWSVAAGNACVEEAADGETAVDAHEAGRVRIETRLVPDRCSG
jgi:hypothetical protein